MRRNVSLEEISNGQLYGENDMVRADCHGCQGCYQCCVGMGNSVILDPCDAYWLQRGLGKGIAELLTEEAVELHVVDGVILPNLKMAGEEERCVYLDAEGRCGIHESRPGLCRLFPLGRYYEDGDFRYFLQNGECRASDRSKVKVGKWIDVPEEEKSNGKEHNAKLYHTFVCSWHALLKQVEERLTEAGDDQLARQVNVQLLQTFYLMPYQMDGDFYGQYEKRLEGFRQQIKAKE